MLNPLTCFKSINLYDVTDYRDEGHTLSCENEQDLPQWSFSGAILVGLKFRISTVHVDSCRNSLKYIYAILGGKFFKFRALTLIRFTTFRYLNSTSYFFCVLKD